MAVNDFSTPPTDARSGDKLPRRVVVTASRWLQHESLFQGLVLSGFGLLLILVTWVQQLGIGGVPIRSLFGVLLLGALMAVRPAVFSHVLSVHKNMLYLIAGFAILGVGVSFINDMEPARIIRELTEIHVQTAVCLLVGATVAEICGPKPMVIAIVAAVAVSGLVAVGQFLEIDAAWGVRSLLHTFNYDPFDRGEDGRASGLSFSPISLATELCLALGAYAIYRQRRAEARGTPSAFDPTIVLATVVFAGVCLASGNRSPLVGGAAFLLLYTLFRAPKWALFVAPLVILAIPATDVMFSHLQGTGLRAFETGDKSSEGRPTLIYYGIRLFIDRPIGYGLDFSPTRYWVKYWNEFKDMPNSGVIITYPLHNYILNMLNFYGIAVIFLMPLAVRMAVRNSSLWLAFVPYTAHILLHNYGPFWNDTMIFFVLALAWPGLYGMAVAQPAVRHERVTTARAARAARVARRSSGGRRPAQGGEPGLQSAE